MQKGIFRSEPIQAMRKYLCRMLQLQLRMPVEQQLLSNRSGMLDSPIEIDVPDISASQSPNTGIIPFTSVGLIAHLEDHEQIRVEGLQVFPNVITTQNLEMIPLSELPAQWGKEEIFDTPAQNL